MPVLIIDPNKKTGELARDAIRWIDRRIRIEIAEDGAQAWNKALEHRPYMVMCDPSLPDVHGGALCDRLVEHLPKTTFIGYTEKPQVRQPGPFHGFLSKPPDRFAVLSALSSANQRKKMTLPERNSDSGIYKRDRKPGGTPQINIMVSIVDDELNFNIGVPKGATVGMALRQIGKTRVNWYELFRHGSPLESKHHMVLHEGDALRLKL
jgi:CheY-like chemotaxis protein